MALSIGPQASPAGSVQQKPTRLWVASSAGFEPQKFEESLGDGRLIDVVIDVGQVATNEGKLLHPARVERLQHRKRRYQHMTARRQKGSNRRVRAKRTRNRTRATIANQLQRWAHETARRMPNQTHMVAVAALSVKRVVQKAGLNRSIQATG